jgi:hypothetical protein
VLNPAALDRMVRRLSRLRHDLATLQATEGIKFIGHHSAEAEIVLDGLAHAGHPRLAAEYRLAWDGFCEALRVLQEATMREDKPATDAARRRASEAEDRFERVRTVAFAWIREAIGAHSGAQSRRAGGPGHF